MSRPNDATRMYNEFNRLWLNHTQEDADEIALQGMYRRKLTEQAIARFQWEGMPESIDLRWLEHKLFYANLALVFKDDRYGAIIATAATPRGDFNLYDNPRSFYAFGPSYPGKMLKQSECAPVWGNLTRFGTDADIVNIYSKRLARIDRTIDINVMSARRPKAIAMDEEEMLSIDNLINAINRGDPVIKVTNPGILERIERTLDFGIDPKGIEVLSVIRARLVNECMGMLGIDNANQDKKERLVAAEVDANGEQVDLGKHANLISREQAAELINHRFGLNVTVGYSTDQEEDITNAELYLESGDDAYDSSVERGLGQGNGGVPAIQRGLPSAS